MTWDQVYAMDDAHRKLTPAAQVVLWEESLPRHSTVLDVGCGIGRHAIWMALSRHFVSACDPSVVALKCLEQFAGERDANIPFHQCAAQALPWKADVFDAVLCYSVLHYLPEAELAPALSEMHRVLVPGGQLMLVTRTTEDERATGRIPVAEGDMPMVFLGREALLQLLADAGFIGGHIGRMAIDWPGGLHDDDWVVMTRKGMK